jgi:predicted nucleic acid-binding protein
MNPPTRVFLDTNVYIIGAAFEYTDEAKILHWLGYGEEITPFVEVIVSQDLFQQILRVGRRVKNKDWGAKIVGRLWNDLNLVYVLVQQEDVEEVFRKGEIPREDITVYLAARNGQAQCFISSNHVLIRALCQQTGEFECLKPQAFAKKYLTA